MRFFNFNYIRIVKKKKNLKDKFVFYVLEINMINVKRGKRILNVRVDLKRCLLF